MVEKKKIWGNKQVSWSDQLLKADRDDQKHLMIYLDTSSLIKLLWNEPESDAVHDAITRRESRLAISSVTELEILVQLKAGHLSGKYLLTHPVSPP